MPKIEIVPGGPDASVPLPGGGFRNLAPGQAVEVSQELADRLLAMTPAVFRLVGAEPKAAPEAPKKAPRGKKA